ncbi:hypothetical protein ACFY40_29065 [Streptomyces sp. NPDC012950]|uniref:hypothetical protein n=1 Tax=Streptomyces sp. NPDC012950 TaxID=3364858 RepID=UPI00369CCD0D
MPGIRRADSNESGTRLFEPDGIRTAVALAVAPHHRAGLDSAQDRAGWRVDDFSVSRVYRLFPAYWSLFVGLRLYTLFAVVVLRGVTYSSRIIFCGVWTFAVVAAPTNGFRLLGFSGCR